MIAHDGRRGALLAVVLTALVLAPRAGVAQYGEPPPPAAYGLEGVTVVHADGTRQEGVNVVVRGSAIAAVGTDVEIPPEARPIDGDSLHVHPGLVDAWGSLPVAFPDAPERSEVLPWDPPRTAQRFTPHRRVADHLEATGSTSAEPRRNGIVAMGLLPVDGVAPGRGASVILRRDAEVPRDLVARPELGLGMSFRDAGNAYPSTLFGVLAFLRQSFMDADRMEALQATYRADPAGRTAPPWDPDYEVLVRAAGGELPVFFRADAAGDMRRVLDLADEVGFRPVIVGGGEAWKLADELARRNVAVLVSLDFPVPEEWEPPDEPVDTAAAEPELEPAAAREKARLEDLYANAGRLVEAGVRVALTSGGGEADLREGARKAIEYGLSEADALRALTTVPASILGLPGQARVQAGGPANLVVTSGPLFGEESSVRATLVEGLLEPGEEPGAEGGDR